MAMTENQAAEICKALSDCNRLHMARLLSQGEMCACKILEAFPFSQPTLSHHMRILVASGLVLFRRDGKWCYYSFNRELMQEYTEFLREFGAKQGCGCKCGARKAVKKEEQANKEISKDVGRKKNNDVG